MRDAQLVAVTTVEGGHGRAEAGSGIKAGSGPEAPEVPASPVPASPAPASPAPAGGQPAVERAAVEQPAVEPAAASGSRRRTGWETSYQRSLVAADLWVGLAAGLVAFLLRFGVGVTAYNQLYLLASAALPLGWVAMLAANRAYERRHLFVGTDEYQRVIRAGLWLTAAAAVTSYVLDVPLARGWLLTALLLATLAGVAVRFAIRKRLHARRKRGERLRRVVVAGHPLAVLDLARQLGRERYHGMEVVGACLPPGHRGTELPVPVYGTFDEVAGAVTAAEADTVIVLSCPELSGRALRRLGWQLESDDIDLILASSLIDVAGNRTTIRPVAGLPMLHVEHPRLAGGGRLVKAVVDRLGAVLLTVVLAPVLLVVALAIRISSPGPVLFRQVRVGKHGREFAMYKFRTMYLDASARLAEVRHLNEHDGALFKIRSDPRVTRVGRWLRRLSLDELPQLYNVARGEMSLVGPRPPLPEEVAAYPEELLRRLAVTPGMTGLWQVSGRADLPWDEAVRLDLRYVENWSLSLDLVIMLRTLAAVCRASGAY